VPPCGFGIEATDVMFLKTDVITEDITAEVIVAFTNGTVELDAWLLAFAALDAEVCMTEPDAGVAVDCAVLGAEDALAELDAEDALAELDAAAVPAPVLDAGVTGAAPELASTLGAGDASWRLPTLAVVCRHTASAKDISGSGSGLSRARLPSLMVKGSDSS